VRGTEKDEVEEEVAGGEDEVEETYQH